MTESCALLGRPARQFARLIRSKASPVPPHPIKGAVGPERARWDRSTARQTPTIGRAKPGSGRGWWTVWKDTYARYPYSESVDRNQGREPRFERATGFWRPPNRGESGAHPEMSQMPIPKTERVCCPIWASRFYPARSVLHSGHFISSRSFDLHDDFAAAAPCPPVFVGSRGVFKGEHLRHLDA